MVYIMRKTLSGTKIDWSWDMYGRWMECQAYFEVKIEFLDHKDAMFQSVAAVISAILHCRAMHLNNSVPF